MACRVRYVSAGCISRLLLQSLVACTRLTFRVPALLGSMAAFLFSSSLETHAHGQSGLFTAVSELIRANLFPLLLRYSVSQPLSGLRLREQIIGDEGPGFPFGTTDPQLTLAYYRNDEAEMLHIVSDTGYWCILGSCRPYSDVLSASSSNGPTYLSCRSSLRRQAHIERYFRLD